MLISLRGEDLRRDALGVLGLGDALDASVRVADDAPVLAGIVELDRHDGRLGVFGAVRFEEGRDCLGAQERVVAREDDDLLRGLDRLERRDHRAAGAVCLGLNDGFGSFGQACAQVVLGTDDREHTSCTGLTRGVNRPGDHRPPRDCVENLRNRGAHARSLARGHDQDRRRFAGAGHAPIVEARLVAVPVGTDSCRALPRGGIATHIVGIPTLGEF